MVRHTGLSDSALDSRAVRSIVRVGAVALFILVWQLVVWWEIWPPQIIPSPTAVWNRFIQSVTVDEKGRQGIGGDYLWVHVWASVRRLLIGVGAAIVVGIPLGIAMGSIRFVRIALEPFVNFIRSLPPLAYFSLLIIWFGIEDTSKIWLLFLAAVAPIALSVVSGIESARTSWIEAAQSMGASPLQVQIRTVLPAVLPDLFTGLRLAVGFAFTTIVAAETVDGLPGIGGLAWTTKSLLQTDTAILCVIVIGITAVVIDLLIRAVERRVVPWKGRA